MEKKIINVISITKILSEKEISEFKKEVLPKLELHACHKNAAYVCQYLYNKGYTECKFVDGILHYSRIDLPHCFNKIKVKGKTYYFDATAEFVAGPSKIFSYSVNQEYTGFEIYDIFNKEEESFVPSEGFINRFGEYVYYKGMNRIVA